MKPVIRHDPASGRFWTVVEDRESYLVYTRTGEHSIDMQSTFCEPGAPAEVPASRGIIDNINRFNEELRRLGARVIWVNHANVHRESQSDWSQFFDRFVADEVRQKTLESLSPEAIGQVGGETIFARTGKIRVIRAAGAESAVYTVDLNAIRAGDQSTNMLLRSGDIVYVPPNVFARIGYAMNALLLPFQPFMGVAYAFIGSAIAN